MRILASYPDLIGADLERSVVFAADPMSAPTHVYVIATRSPSVTREVTLSYQKDERPYLVLEVEVLGKGPYLAFAIGRVITPGRSMEVLPALVGVPLSGNSSTAESIPFSAIKNPRVLGLVGDRFPKSRRLVPEVRGNPLGVVCYPDPHAPMAMPAPPHETNYRLAVDNDELSVLLPYQESSSSTFDVFDKHTKTWHQAGTPFRSLFVRACGYWLAFTGSEPAEGMRVPIPGAPLNHVQVVRGGTHAGNPDSRDTIVSGHMTIQMELELSGHSHSGQLFISNQKIGAEYEIDTGEADSEVVLVTDEFVIYRVNDLLMRASIVGGKLDTPVVFAKGEEVAGTHWIFEGPGPARPHN